jgi:hypothetical protein
MSASISRPARPPQRFGRLWWLPPHGHGNGLDDDAWAPILDVPADRVTPLLTALRAAAVPAYAAAAPVRPARRAARAATPPGYRIWVGSSAHARAEDTLIRLGHLTPERERPAGPAGR